MSVSSGGIQEDRQMQSDGIMNQTEVNFKCAASKLVKYTNTNDE